MLQAEATVQLSESRIGRVRAVLGLGLVLLCATASAQEQSRPEHWSAAERARIFATLPNWSGLWESKWLAAADNLTGYPTAEGGPLTEFLTRYVPLGAKPPYKPGLQSGQQTSDWSQKTCADIRFPAVLEWPRMFQLFVTPEETLFLYDDGDVRHIYTDGRKHPKQEDLWPTHRGNSIGHWEGSTLVIDTIEVKAGRILPFPGVADLSEQAHFTERVRRVDSNTMQDDLTIDDPVRLAHPWQVSTRWSRVQDQDRLLPFDCDNDRNVVVNGKITVAPP
jgi:hypothetical protein